MRLRPAIHLSTLSVSFLLAAASGHAADRACPNPQSPRNLDLHSRPPPSYQTSPHSIVDIDRRLIANIPISRDTDRSFPGQMPYSSRANGHQQLLYRCGQHYHYPIENPQGCPGELPATGAPGTRPEPGQWVEIHTLYAPKVTEKCSNPESTDCCLGQPVLVMAFIAQVTAADCSNSIYVPPMHDSLFEWSGSATGPDKSPGECKEPAQWSVWMDCGLEVTEAQLKKFSHPEKSRGLQTGARLGYDLTLFTFPQLERSDVMQGH